MGWLERVKEMKILFIGDIFGQSGRKLVEDHLYRIKNEYHIDFVIANGENAAHGKGITKRIYNDFIFNGIHAITMGNHTWAKRELFDCIDELDHLVVPINQLPTLPGVGSRVFTCNGKKIRVTNLLGNTFMQPGLENAFIVMDRLLEKCDEDIHIVDFHAEATSEKIALGYYLTGKVSAVLGTHTHVPTADERILEGKTAYISDVGMTGPLDGVIGCSKESIIPRMINGLPTKFEVAEGKSQFNAVIIEFDQNNLPIKIQRLQFFD